MSKKGISLHTALKRYDLNQEQQVAVNNILNNKITVLTGQAGTAKSFTAVYAALRLMTSNNDIERTSLTRPMVSTERMGFLPGREDEKYSPYILPLVEFFNKFGDSGDRTYTSLVAAGKVLTRPLAFLRGVTIEDEIMILDEAQNVTPEQMLMVLTRISSSGKLVITGDTAQDDLPGKTPTGLDYVVALTRKLPYIQHIRMTENMRDPAIQEIIDNWGLDVLPA